MRRGYRVELFQIPRTAVRASAGRRRFARHFIKDYGDELIETG
jgi:hypothetical protein